MEATTLKDHGSYSTAVWLYMLCAFLFCYTFYKGVMSRLKTLPPGPRGLGAMVCMIKSLKEGTLHKQAQVWSDQYGELVLCRTPIGNFCFLNSVRMIREMLTHKEREALTNDRPRSFPGWYILYNYRDVVSSGPNFDSDWLKRRRLFHQAIKFYGDGVERFESTVQKQLERLTSEIDGKAGGEIDMENLLSYSLLCVLIVLLTGECPERGSKTIELIRCLMDTDNEAFDASVDAAMCAAPFLRFVPGTYYRDLCRRIESSRDLVMEELFTKTKASHTPGQPRGIIDVLLDEQLKGENHWLKDDNIRGIIINILAGGFLSSLNTLKATFLYLTHNPEAISKIQKELDDVIGERPPNVKDKYDLPYTEAVILETLRCSSIIPLGVTHETREDVELNGFTVPKGCTVYTNILAVHHDPAKWDDPDRFRPERFLDDKGQLLPAIHPVRHSLLPFGVGRRSCPGENFGRTRVFLYVTTLLQKFDILPPVKHDLPAADPYCFGSGNVLVPQPYHLIFRRRT
ncbi:hypothetical protein BaRGS_00028225 [Batillaria attramentaria]|uniref:Cytochrome P450 n=1 Tax=Batillaria attramentaria TaxID=370345 RepID=A0ABD0K0E9_9CAEN